MRKEGEVARNNSTSTSSGGDGETEAGAAEQNTTTTATAAAPEPAPEPETATAEASLDREEPAAAGMQVVTAGGESVSGSAKLPQLTKSKPYLLRVCYPHDQLKVSGAGDDGSELVVTRAFRAVTREQRYAAEDATRGTGMRLRIAMKQEV